MTCHDAHSGQPQCSRCNPKTYLSTHSYSIGNTLHYWFNAICLNLLNQTMPGYNGFVCFWFASTKFQNLVPTFYVKYQITNPVKGQKYFRTLSLFAIAKILFKYCFMLGQKPVKDL